MRITDAIIEQLNFQLDDLKIDGAASFTLTDFILSDDVMDVESSLKKINDTIKQLLNRLQYYDNTILAISDQPSLEEIFAALGNYAPIFRQDTEYVYYRLLSHIISCLQGERMMTAKKLKQQSSQASNERAKIAHCLEKLCQIFLLPIEENFSDLDEVAIIDRLCSHIEESMRSLNITNIFENQQLIIPPGTVLTPQQQVIFDTMSEAIYQDFLIRRRMLIKRLDVTIQSFIWSDQVKGRKDEVLSAIKVQRENIVEEPTRYTLDDVLHAPVALIHESTKKITEQKGGSKSLVKTIIIGDVPDRGGRTDDVRKVGASGSFGKSSGGGKKHFNNNQRGGRGGDRQANKRGRF